MTTPYIPPPEWWPLEGEPIGLERATELVAYLKVKAPPIIDIARKHLEERHAGLSVKVSGHSARQIALEVLKPRDGGIWVGSMAVTSAGTIVEQGVVELDRAGYVRVTFAAKGGGPRWTVAV